MAIGKAKWFDDEYYMQQKLLQMQVNEPDYTLTKLMNVFAENGFSGEEGHLRHFAKYGCSSREDISPSSMFDAKAYYMYKAQQFYNLESVNDVTEFQAASMESAIKGAHMSAWTHYVRYGTKEGINPSNTFNTSAYMAAKLKALNDANIKDADGNAYTEESLVEAFRAAHLSALEHAIQFGTDEGNAKPGEVVCWTSDVHTEGTLMTDFVASADPILPAETTDVFLLTKDIDSALQQSSVKGFWSLSESQTTYQLADAVSGTSGENDHIDVTLIATNGATYTGYETKDIETFNLKYIDSADTPDFVMIGAGGYEGLKTFAINNSIVSNRTSQDTVTLTDLEPGTQLSFAKNSSQLDVLANYVELTGDGDTLDLLFDTGKLGTFTAGDGFANVNVTTLGNATVTGFDLGTATNLTITGEKDLSVGTVNTEVTNIDASGASGNIHLGTVASRDLQAKGGSGTNDRLDLTLDASIVDGMHVEGFETIGLASSKNITLDFATITGANAIDIFGDEALAALSNKTMTLNNMPNSATITYVGTGEDEAMSFNKVKYVQTDAKGSADTVTLALNNGGKYVGPLDENDASQAADIGTFTAAGVDSLTFAVSDFSAVDAHMVLASAGSFVATAPGTLNLRLDSPALSYLDMSGVAGDTHVTLNNVTNNFTYVGTSAIDTIASNALHGTAAITQNFNLGTGNDEFSLSVSQNYNATVNIAGEGGDDLFTYNEESFAGRLSLNGGSGTDKFEIGANTTDLTFAMSNIEDVTILKHNNALTMHVNLGSAFEDSFTITDVSGQTNTMNVHADEGGAVSGAGITLLGSNGLNMNYISNGLGETFTFGAKGSELIESYVANSKTTTPGVITGFQTADATDKINLSAFRTATNFNATTDMTSAANINDATTYVVNFESAIDTMDFATTDYASLFGDGKAFLTVSENANAAIVVQGTDVTQIYAVNSTDAVLAASDITFLGTMTDVNNTNVFIADDFA